MRHRPLSSDLSFKGIALFTPGGDLVYCIDPKKKSRWHLQLCAVLQDVLGLSEPPHFLVPCYTATVDRWVDSGTQQSMVVAEASPLVIRHQALLNAVFGIDDCQWIPLPLDRELCDPLVIQHFQVRFPQLWDAHDLVIKTTQHTYTEATEVADTAHVPLWSPQANPKASQGYVLRLFISGHGAATEHILQHLHEILEQSLHEPYTLKVIDVHKNPELAEANQISATPTLVKVWPPPVKKVVGNLSDVSTLQNLLAAPKPREADFEEL